jgi:hypothetical protein
MLCRFRLRPGLNLLDLAEAQPILRLLLGVTLRAEPVDTAIPIQPVVNVGLALQSFDVPVLNAGVLGNDLPVILDNALHFEDHSGRFSHLSLCHAGAPSNSAAK